MPDITVKRHGDRWSVAEPGTESPTGEFATREEAELEARRLADGGAVKVVEDDASGLADAQDTPRSDTGPATAGPSTADERARTRQAGL